MRRLAARQFGRKIGHTEGQAKIIANVKDVVPFEAYKPGLAGNG